MSKLLRCTYNDDVTIGITLREAETISKDNVKEIL